jgi:hypothetical protein
LQLQIKQKIFINLPTDLTYIQITTLMKNKYICIFILLFCALPNVVFSQLFVFADRPTARYSVGDTIFFIAQSNFDTSATFTIKSAINADLPPLSMGTCRVRNGYAFITYVAKSAGFVQCAVTQKGQTNYAGAAIAPFSIQPTEPEAGAFDAFWAGQKPMPSNILLMSGYPMGKGLTAI